MKKSEDINSILGYVLLIITGLVSYYLDNGLKLQIIIPLSFVLLVIKDIYIHLYEEKNKKISSYSVIGTINDFQTKKISLTNTSLIINKILIFPMLLISYIFIINISQIKSYSIIEDKFLLIIVLVSGFFTIFSKLEKGNTTRSKDFIPVEILLAMLCSLSGTYVILIQTNQLNVIGSIISIISGILIFLVSISIIEDEKSAGKEKYT